MIEAFVYFFLKRYYALRRSRVKKKFNRFLPFSDYLVDRWEKAKSCGFGEGTSIYDNVLVLGDVKVGKNTWIGPNCILDGSGGSLVIGDNCSISAGVHIYTHNTVQKALSAGLESIATQSVFIGNNCYLGPNAVIAMGSCIEDGCIGALTLVNGDKIPPIQKHGIPATIRRI